MNAGKSTALLQVAHNYESLGQSILVYTSAIDDRYGVGVVTSRLGVSRAASVFTPDTSFAPLNIDGVSCLLIDESQFLTGEQVRQLHVLTAVKDLPVMCYGLRTDFLGRPFEGAASLLALADKIQEVKTICRCTRKATMNLRLGAQGRPETKGPQVEIAGNARYSSVCPHCYYKAMAEAS